MMRTGHFGAMRATAFAEGLPESQLHGAVPARGVIVTFPVVALGASAGGLEACTRFMTALPTATGMAFILVQHLDPSHESMMADLLAKHTSMPVREVENGTAIEPDHVYVIPPGTYLSVADDTLHLSEPLARHGARLPFDYLLQSLAEAVGSRTICVVLSGT